MSTVRFCVEVKVLVHRSHDESELQKEVPSIEGNLCLCSQVPFQPLILALVIQAPLLSQLSVFWYFDL